MIRNIFIRLFTVLALIGYQGCAHTGPILSDLTQEEMDRIGVLVMPHSNSKCTTGFMKDFVRGSIA